MEGGKAPGFDGTLHELMKALSKKSKEKLDFMVKDMYERRKTHVDFSRAVMIPLPKILGSNLL